MNFRKIVKLFIPKKLFRLIEPWGHLSEAVIFNLIYGFPARGLKVIGVTGTDGKTTTSFLIHKMLDEAGYKVGLMTTVSYGVGDKLMPQKAHMTTTPVPTLLKQIKQIKREGAQWLVLETTSHALAQNRVWGIPYSMAVLTNVSREHLDYHGTFHRYLEAKRRLFKKANANKNGYRTGVVNADDARSELFESDTLISVTYGIKNGEFRAGNIKLTPSGSSYTAKFEEDTYEISCNLPGRFNIYNSLAAAAVGKVVGLNKKQVEQGIAALKNVPGRMQEIDEGQDFKVIIDYAVSPSALETALKTLRETTKGKVILVFGATGDRDRGKRPLMGAIAAKNADKIFLTDDETYTEHSAGIRKAVHIGIQKAGGMAKTKEIADRRDAIKTAIKTAQKGDAVIITGMGHQTTRNMGGREVPWSDLEEARKALKTLA